MPLPDSSTLAYGLYVGPLLKEVLVKPKPPLVTEFSSFASSMLSSQEVTVALVSIMPIKSLGSITATMITGEIS